jgi:glutamate formiminotransferase
MRSGELAPDLGPPEPHSRAGATLVTARPPLAAFNLLLDTGELEIAAAIAAELRESGGGPPGLRAMAVDLDGRAQVSTNVHDPVAVPLAEVISRVRELAGARGVEVAEGEVVGLVPEAALRGLPDDLPLGRFDPARQVIERRLGVGR